MTRKRKVFISYARKDSTSAEVGELVQWLKGQEGIEVISDHRFPYRAPPQGWYKWMEHSIEEADIVLCICGRAFKAGFEKKGGTPGVIREGDIITADLYEKGGWNEKIHPILPEAGAYTCVPKSLRPWENNIALADREKILRLIREGQTGEEPVLVPPPPPPPPETKGPTLATSSSPLTIEWITTEWKHAKHTRWVVQNILMPMSVFAVVLGVFIMTPAQEPRPPKVVLDDPSLPEPPKQTLVINTWGPPSPPLSEPNRPEVPQDITPEPEPEPPAQLSTTPTKTNAKTSTQTNANNNTQGSDEPPRVDPPAEGTRSAMRFQTPHSIAVDAAGNLYVAGGEGVHKVMRLGVVSKVSFGIGVPQGIAMDSKGNLYITTVDHRIRKVTPGGHVSTLAGSNTPGFSDGQGNEAQFRSPRGIAVDAEDHLYVMDDGNRSIRKVTPWGVVSTLAISNTGGFEFRPHRRIAMDKAGNLYVADTDNHRIRKVTPERHVSTLVGSTAGFADGTGYVARFHSPRGIAVDKEGNLYVADDDNHRIRKVTPGGRVSTLAGSGTPGFADGQGSAAQFKHPRGLAVDAAGNLYVADTANNCLRKVTPAGLVSTLVNEGSDSSPKAVWGRMKP